MFKIISALLLYDLNRLYIDSIYNEILIEEVDLKNPIVISKQGKIVSGEEILLKVLKSKDLINVYYKFEEE